MMMVVTHLSALAAGVLLGAAALYRMGDRRRRERPIGQIDAHIPGPIGTAVSVHYHPEDIARQVGA